MNMALGRIFQRPALGLLAALGLLVCLPALAIAHAVVFPSTSTPGAYEKYVLRVPNEKGVPTIRVEIRVPSEVRIISFEDVPGWSLSTETDAAGHITGAVWTGVLPPQRFVELPFVAVNPEAGARVVWPAFQSYADGERVEWVGPEGSEHPASFTEIVPSGQLEGTSNMALYLAGFATLLALLSLGLVLRR